MEAVDYGDTSDEDTTEQATKSVSSSRSKKHDHSLSTNDNTNNNADLITNSNLQTQTQIQPKPRQPMTQSDIINNNLDNLASLIPILQSHQQLIDAESISLSLQNKKHKHSSNSNHANSNSNSNSHSNSSKKSNIIAPLPPPHEQAVLPIISSNNTESIAYYILRSNNEENVRTSMEKGVWATQPQNEPILNDAFEKFDKVILFFSVCRSMHFQGVACMTSRIGHRKSRSLWESDPNIRGGKSKWGGTFDICWLRIFDLAFDQTNNICNAWNGNRPVKFSRDGQAAPANVGQQLTHLFDIGVVEFGQGSAILRKPIRIGNVENNYAIAVQKIFVNGRFIAATDLQTAQNMIALEEQQQKQQQQQQNERQRQRQRQFKPHAHAHSMSHNNNNRNNNNLNLDLDLNSNAAAQTALNRLVNSLQNQAQTNNIGNVNVNNTVNTNNSLLNIASLLSKDNTKVKTNDRRDRTRHSRHKRDGERRHRDRSRSRNRNRHKHRHGNRDKKRRGRKRHSESESDSYDSSESDRESRRNHDHKKYGKHKNKNHKRHKRENRNDRKTREQNVITSLWTQINLQQALIAQSGLYNALGNNTNNIASENNNSNITDVTPQKYPSNRGGVY